MPRRNRKRTYGQKSKGLLRPRSWHHSRSSKGQKLPGWVEPDRKAA